MDASLLALAKFIYYWLKCLSLISQSYKLIKFYTLVPLLLTTHPSPYRKHSSNLQLVLVVCVFVIDLNWFKFKRFVKTCKGWEATHLHRRETFENLFTCCSSEENSFRDFKKFFKFEWWYNFHVADQNTALYSLCSADNLFSSRAFLLNLLPVYKIISLLKIMIIFPSCCYLRYLLLISPHSLGLPDLRVPFSAVHI